MITKSLPGVQISYFESKTNYKNELRPILEGTEPTRWIGGRPVRVEEWLEQTAPPHVKDDRRHRKVGHSRQHLSHLIIGFSESYQEIEPLRPLAIRATEHLMCAGMPLGSLKFFWCEHPLLQNTHLHGGVVRALLPAGGLYTPALDASLARDYSWLVSRRLRLSNPMDKRRARLVYGCEYSYKNENRAKIDQICQLMEARFAIGKVESHEDFLNLLEDPALGLAGVVVSPGPDGAPVSLDQSTTRLYHHSVAVRTNSGSLIWLAGPACRYGFTGDAARQELEQRVREFADAHKVYARFRKELLRRIEAQREQYGRLPGDFMVTLRTFEWLNPDNDDLCFLSLPMMQLSKHEGADCIRLPDLSVLPPR